MAVASDKACCDCTRHSTCTSTGAKGKPGCACRLAGRKCGHCACQRQCRNQRPALPASGVTIASFFNAPAPPPTPPATHTSPDPLLPPTAPATEPLAPTTASPATVETTDAAAAADAPGEDSIAPELPEPATAGPGTAPPSPTEQGTTGFAALALPVAPPPAGGATDDGTARSSAPTETGADAAGYAPTAADNLLSSVYGDYPHQNDGCHLDGEVPADGSWQRRWKRVVQLPIAAYGVPKGRVGRRFVAALTTEFQGVLDHKWNSERPIVFAAVILQTTPGVRKAVDIRRRLGNRMDLWEQGHFVSLVDDTEAEVLNRGSGGGRKVDDATRARAFNGKVLSGRLRQAVQALTRGDKGGVLQPDENCTKTGRPVLEILREKHPKMRIQDLDAADRSCFEPYDRTPQPLPVEITAEDVEEIASRLSGAAGPGGTDSVDLRNWLLRFGVESEGLRRCMARMTEWIANEAPPWAAIRALMACRLVALDKMPGVRPVGIGEIYRRLMAKCLLKVVGHQATTACGNLNLCAGLPVGIEGAVHAIRETWDSFESEEPTVETMPGGDKSAMADTDPEGGVATAQEPKAVVQIDARNGFNELSRQSMLWTVRHRWAAGSRFAFNCYRHAAQLVLRSKGNDAYILLSHEGVTQGDPLSMVLYGLALLPLAELLRKQEPTVIQPWYADDTAMAGSVSGIARAMTLLLRHGPQRGYYPEPAKSILICRPVDRDRAKEALAEYDFQYHDGYRYVGGFVGTAATENVWLEPKIQQWVRGIESLAKVAKRYPQTAYAGLTKAHQSEWQYLQRVTPANSDLFQPLEDAIRNTFIPNLLGEEARPTDDERQLYGLTVKSAGLGIPNPTGTAAECHNASTACSGELAASLRANADLDVKAHWDEVKKARRTQAHVRCKRE